MTISIPTLFGQTILIVDGVSLAAAEMSNRLAALGAKVHVVANARAAMRLAAAKAVDVALIGYRPEDSSLELVNFLERQGISCIRCASTSRHDRVDYRKAFSVVLAAPMQTELLAH